MPHSVKRAINESAYVFKSGKVEKRGGGGQWTSPSVTSLSSSGLSSSDLIAELTRDMLEAADNLEFERAAYLRDQIKELKKQV